MTKRNKGFTLIELLTTVIIMGVILALGIPSFNDTIRNNRMSTQINELVTGVNLARSEAVKRGSTITTCIRNTAGTGCLAGTSWLTGWLVFDDLDADGTIDPGEIIIRDHGPLNKVSSLVYSGGARITYDARGFARLAFSGTMKLCDDRGANEAKAFVVSPNGRVRQAIDSNNNGIVEDGSGTDVTCP